MKDTVLLILGERFLEYEKYIREHTESLAVVRANQTSFHWDAESILMDKLDKAIGKQKQCKAAMNWVKNDNHPLRWKP